MSDTAPSAQSAVAPTLDRALMQRLREAAKWACDHKRQTCEDVGCDGQLLRDLLAALESPHV